MLKRTKRETFVKLRLWQMNLAFTHEQLTLETIATTLNGAYVATKIIMLQAGTNREHQVAEACLDDMKFQIMPGRKDDIVFRSYIPFSSNYKEQNLRKAADFLDNYSVDMTYVASLDDGRHLMCFHLNHVIPEDETISPAYLVKLSRYFVKVVHQHLDNWPVIESMACGPA